jgi:hypothetical protein
MRDGAWLINTARGSIVDADALTRECVSGAPRNGLISGCCPLDDSYKDMPEGIELAAIKKVRRKPTRR